MENRNKFSGFYKIIVFILVIITFSGCQQAPSTSVVKTPTVVPQANVTSAVVIITPTGVTTTSDKPNTESTQSTPILATLVPITLEGAKVTASGLQYLEEKAGDGPAPNIGDIISMHYVATLSNGTELFSSYKMNQPAITAWGKKKLLPGWEEGIGLMKAGGKSKFVIPPDLAFGAKGDNQIPPNSQIILEVELLSVKPAPMPEIIAEDKYTKKDSGLKYFDIAVGNGAEAKEKNSISSHFTIWVKNENGYDYIVTSEGQDPLDFIVGKKDLVIPGWDEGVLGMKIGGIRQLIIPASLGFGAQGKGDIPPNADLVMEIQLLDVREPRTAEKVEEKNYTTTQSGLKLFDIKTGTGNSPVKGQTVVVNYTGWLQDGTQFDSSLDRNEPFSFQFGVGNVIPGWDEGLATMKVGGKRQLVIPAALGYGDKGAGSTIPPGATLVFDIELLEVK